MISRQESGGGRLGHQHIGRGSDETGIGEVLERVVGQVGDDMRIHRHRLVEGEEQCVPVGLGARCPLHADDEPFKRQLRLTLTPSPLTPWLNAAGPVALLVGYAWLNRPLVGIGLLLLLLLLTAGRAWLARRRQPAWPDAMLVTVLLWALLVGASAALAMLSGRFVLILFAGLTITASASFAHDIYASVLKSHKVTEAEQVKVSRITAVVLGVFAIGLGILANGQNVAFLVALAFAVAASANLPTIVYSLYWKRFNTRGALWSMYGVLISCIVLIVFSPAVSGSKTAMIPGADFAWFPLANPGIVSIPLAFALGIIGTLTSKDTGDPAVNAEMEVRSLTGVGAEKAVTH